MENLTVTSTNDLNKVSIPNVGQMGTLKDTIGQVKYLRYIVFLMTLFQSTEEFSSFDKIQDVWLGLCSSLNNHQTLLWTSLLKQAQY